MNDFDGTESLTYAPHTVDVEKRDPMILHSGVLANDDKPTGIKFQIGVDPDWDYPEPPKERVEVLKLSVGESRMAWLIQLSRNDSVSLAQAREMHPELDGILKDLEYAAQLRSDSW